MNQFVSLLETYATMYINAMEYVFVTIWYLPLIGNITLGPIILFFMILTFVFGLLVHYLGGSSDG